MTTPTHHAGDGERRRRISRVMKGAIVAAASLVAATRLGAQGESRATSIRSVSCKLSTTPADSAPIRWRGDALRWGEWRVTLGRNVAARIIAVTLDPHRIPLALALLQQDGALVPWSIDAAPADARLAMNAGQFTDEGPWGWIVHRGREWQAPGVGDLAGAFVIDTSGSARVLRAAEIGAWRGGAAIREAVQSYPMLLEGEGRPPAGLCAATATVYLDHRDARLAIGVRRDGTVVVAMSRYDGAALPARTPIGPTTPEMAEIMRRLGAMSAIMLDGGLSAQLLVRPRIGGAPMAWPGLRNVPLALVGTDAPAR